MQKRTYYGINNLTMGHNSALNDQKILLNALRQFLKKRGITYHSLATILGVSERTIKRMFSGKSPISLPKLLAICDAIGISLYDLVSLTKSEGEENYYLNEAQERYLVHHLGLWGVLLKLHSGESAQTIAKYWGLNAREMFLVLRKLEKIGLVEVFPENVARIAVRGTLRWPKTGIMLKRHLREPNNEFFDFVYENLDNDSVTIQSTEIGMSAGTFREMANELQELGSRYRTRAQREGQALKKSQLESIRWVIALAPFEIDWRKYPL